MNILIVKIGAIGDVVMALPILTHIKKLHPAHHLDWRIASQIAARIDRIDRSDLHGG
jgi:heptosyltransferase-1